MYTTEETGQRTAISELEESVNRPAIDIVHHRSSVCTESLSLKAQPIVGSPFSVVIVSWNIPCYHCWIWMEMTVENTRKMFDVEDAVVAIPIAWI